MLYEAVGFQLGGFSGGCLIGFGLLNVIPNGWRTGAGGKEETV